MPTMTEPTWGEPLAERWPPVPARPTLRSRLGVLVRHPDARLIAVALSAVAAAANLGMAIVHTRPAASPSWSEPAPNGRVLALRAQPGQTVDTGFAVARVECKPRCEVAGGDIPAGIAETMAAPPGQTVHVDMPEGGWLLVTER